MALKCGWGKSVTAEAYNHCASIGGERVQNYYSYKYLPKLPWQRGYHDTYEGGQCGEPPPTPR
jgi:hypothetical protein